MEPAAREESRSAKARRGGRCCARRRTAQVALDGLPVARRLARLVLSLRTPGVSGWRRSGRAQRRACRSGPPGAPALRRCTARTALPRSTRSCRCRSCGERGKRVSGRTAHVMCPRPACSNLRRAAPLGRRARPRPGAAAAAARRCARERRCARAPGAGKGCRATAAARRGRTHPGVYALAAAASASSSSASDARRGIPPGRHGPWTGACSFGTRPATAQERGIGARGAGAGAYHRGLHAAAKFRERRRGASSAAAHRPIVARRAALQGATSTMIAAPCRGRRRC